MGSIQQEVQNLGAPGGSCAHCGEHNAYTNLACTACGARLPWADAITGGATNIHTSTHAPLSIANARVTVSHPVRKPVVDVKDALGPKAPLAMLLVLICGALMGMALVGPYILRSQPALHPTPAASQNTTPSITAPAPVLMQPNTSAPQAPISASPGAGSPIGQTGKEPLTVAERGYVDTVMQITDDIKPDYPMDDATARASRRAKLQSYMEKLGVAPTSTRLINLGAGRLDSLLIDAMKEDMITINLLDSAFEDKDTAKGKEALEHWKKAGALYSEASRLGADILRQLGK